VSKKQAHDDARYAGVRRQGAQFSQHQFDALAGWGKTEGKSDLVYVQDENIMIYKVSRNFYAKLQNNKTIIYNVAL
jgi:hypothetical protein